MKVKRSNTKDFGLTGLARIGVATVLAFAGLMTVGVGTSNATTLQTEGTYPTREACHAAGPGVKATTPGDLEHLLVRPGSHRCQYLAPRSSQLTLSEQSFRA